MSTITPKPWTADELSRLPRGWRYEVDEGDLVIMSPAGWRHARLVTQIDRMLAGFVDSRGLGQVGSGELGIHLRREPTAILRGADVAFYGSARLKQLGEEEGFPDVPPDLVVEVHLPDEDDMLRKVEQYLAAGVRSVWVVDPHRWSLAQHHSGRAPQLLTDPDAQVEDPALPGFVCRLRDLLGEAPTTK